MHDSIISESENHHIDRLHDDLLRLILNRVHDAKSLCACLAVSTRFNSLALHSTRLSLSVDRIHFDDDDDDESAPNSKHNLLRSLFRLLISTPLRFLTRLAANSSTTADSSSSSSAVFYSPSQALKSFSSIEILKIQLPSHGDLRLDRSTNPVLKWKATFGSELKTCVIVAGSSVIDADEEEERRGDSELDSGTKRDKEEQQDGIGRLEMMRATAPFAISNEDLKTRVVWTISCLIAASSRHHLLKRIVSEHPMLKGIEMVDERQQGTLTMDETEIAQLRTTTFINSNKADSSSSSSDESTERSRIPALKMKMWHAAELELPGCRKVMRGATLVVIGAADGDGVGDVDGMFEGAGEEETMMYGEAAREIRRKMKQSYSLEMESF